MEKWELEKSEEPSSEEHSSTEASEAQKQCPSLRNNASWRQFSSALPSHNFYTVLKVGTSTGKNPDEKLGFWKWSGACEEEEYKRERKRKMDQMRRDRWEEKNRETVCVFEAVILCVVGFALWYVLRCWGWFWCDFFSVCLWRCGKGRWRVVKGLANRPVLHLP